VQEQIREAGIKKAASDDEDLARILTAYGLSQADTAGKGVAGNAWKIPPKLRAEIIESKIVAVQNITRETRERVQRVIRDILIAASTEQPAPSAQTIARRIRLAVDSDAQTVFSPERAITIARTELVQTENAAIHAAAADVGITEFEWAAYSDGKSGDRHHERLDGEKIKLGETFTTPLGNVMRFPGDPEAPIEDTINCRCALIPVR
jgi:hypothetical protein